MRNPGFPRRRRLAGLTFVEMMVSVSIFTMVGLFVSTATLAMARQSRQSLTAIPAQADAFRAIERIRLRLLPGQSGTASLTDSGRGVAFANPIAGGTSAIRFNSDTGEIRYFADASGTSSAFIADVANCTFQVTPNGRQVRVTVSLDSRTLRNDATQIAYSEAMTLRN